MSTSQVLRTLPEGLIIRRASHADAENLAAFNARIHSDTDEPDTRVADWTRDLLSGSHPTFAPQDFTLVEEPQTGKIVSALNLISQTWTFAGIPFKVGRPELVGTDTAYRNRGLVRQQFEIIHEWSRQRGELMQGITGIPFYYRQFGYEMTVNLGGGRVGGSFTLPQWKAEEPEPYRFRPAEPADVLLIARLYSEGTRRSLLASKWDETLWRYELTGKSRNNVNRHELRIIENAAGEAVGVLGHPAFLWGDMLATNLYELRAGAPWQEITPAVMRYLWRTGEEYARLNGGKMQAFGFWLIDNHPAFQVAAACLPKIRPHYAWYLRVPDLPAFIRLIAPVLEERLAQSPVAGYTGDLRLGFYRSGLSLNFQAGRLAQIETWQPSTKNFGKAAYPGLTFLQVLFGYRTQDELENSFADCTSDTDVEPVLRALFPKLPSDILPVD
jgi:hypothetical protein